MLRSWYKRAMRLGRPRVPPLPLASILTDRATGSEYVLSHSGTPGSLTLFLDPNPWPRPDYVVYGEDDGPYANGYRLYIEDATLKAEPASGFYSPDTFTRKSFDRTFLKIGVTSGNITTTEVTV